MGSAELGAGSAAAGGMTIAQGPPWKAWYKTARWQRLRWKVLARDLFTCQKCRKTETNTALLVADHIKPHKGDPILFWDEANIQCLCKRCHDSEKQREERSRKVAIGPDGWPIEA